MRAAEAGFAAALHERALPHGFFGRLGRPFLTTYYRTFVDSPHAVALLAVAGNEPAGVLVGTVSNAAHYRWVAQRRAVRLALAGTSGLLGRPRLSWYFLRTRTRRYAGALRRHRSGRQAPAATPAARSRRLGDVAVLTHVSVDERWRAQGTGTLLVERFLDAARAGPAAVAALVTLAGDDGAGAFYARRGWTHLRDKPDRDGRMLASYRYRLQNGPS